MLPAMARSLFWLSTWLFALGVACGGKAVVDGDPRQGTGGSTDPLAGVMCGAAGSCTFSCCFDLTIEDAVPFCATNCNAGVSAFSCDGPEDCAGGACCGDVTGTQCQPTCEPGDLTRCHTDADCDGGACDQATLGEVDVSVCAE